MVHPLDLEGREPVDQEFIELWNRGDEPVDLTGWRFDRGVQFTFPAITLVPDAFVVITRDPNTASALNITDPLGPWVGQLSNGGERLRLVDANGTTVDEVHYADSGDWADRRQVIINGQASWEWIAPFDGDGYSLELVNPALPNDSGQNWKSSLALGGTPGLPNSRHDDLSAPLIHNVRHHPAIPTSQEEVVIRADITPISASAEVRLYYRESTLIPRAFTSLLMTPEPSGCHVATIPTHRDQTVIEFYVAVTTQNATRTWPAPSDDLGAQDANALYQVDDEFESSDQAYYRIMMTAAEDTRFRPETFPASSDAQMNATFVVSRNGDTSIRYQTGLRRRGNGSRGRNPRSFRLTLPSDTPWRSITSLNLVAQYTYLQAFGLHLFKAAQLPAPEAQLVQLRLNGTNYANEGNQFNVHYGSYAHIQPLSGEFIDQALPDDNGGDLYKKVSANPSRDRKRWGVHFENQIVYNNPNWYLADQWTKETNSSANDWSRFQQFILTMNEAPAETYFEEVSRTVNVDQWVRWFALMNLINNRETNLSNGIDDDYSIYQGIHDPRIILLPHDLDTIFGLGDTTTRSDATIFQMLDENFGTGAARMPQLEAFFNHPKIRPLYYQALKDLIETVLSPDRFEPLLDSLLSHVPTTVRQRIKDFNRERRAHVSALIDAPLSLTEIDLPTRNGVYESFETMISLTGMVSPRLVERVTINGQDSDYDRGTGSWQAHQIPLRIGLNRLEISALASEGEILSSVSVNVIRLGTFPTQLSGPLEENTLLTQSEGPYRVTESLTIPSDLTLTIEAGTTLAFDAGTELRANGTLIASGTEALPVVLMGNNGAAWDGLVFTGQASNKQLSHVIVRDIDSDNAAITLNETYLQADHLNLSTHTGIGISLTYASLHLTESELPPNNSIQSEAGLLDGHPLILKGNQLGDVVIGTRPPKDTSTLVFENNRFQNVNTALRFPGNARLFGNQFNNVTTAIHMDGGQALIANQRFSNVGQVVDHSLPVQITLEHCLIDGANTLIPQSIAPIQALVANNVFTNVLQALPESLPDGSLVLLTHNYADPSIGLELEYANARTGVVITGSDPRYSQDGTLAEDSPGKGAGTHGQDLGLIDPNQPSILGRPFAITPSRTAQIGIHGSGWEAIEYRLDDGAWIAAEIPWLPESGAFREAFITLTHLSNGPHVLDFREASTTEVHSIRWTVSDTAWPVVMNEIAAINEHSDIDGTFPDWVELRNLSENPVNLAGFRLGGDRQGSIVLTASHVVSANDYIIIPINSSGDTGFALDRDGETLTLYDPQGSLVDTLSFGRQLSDFTLGRAQTDPQAWVLCRPTPGSSNLPVHVLSSHGVKLNEWYAASGIAYDDDFIELTNIEPTPVDLSRSELIVSQTYRFPDHTFLEPNGFFTLTSNDLGFTFNSWFGSARIVHPDSRATLDEIYWQAQASESSSGRIHDGIGPWQRLSLASPGRSNVIPNPSPSLSDLRISEILYHPNAEDAEWIELVNVGQETLDLTGAHFSAGLEFTFGDFQLEPNARAVLVSDEAAFRNRHGSDPTIAGVFTGRLDNSGERIALQLPPPNDEQILSFAFEPDWYPSTNGGYYALVVRHEPRGMSSQREDWKAGAVVGGSPGRPEVPLIYSERETDIILGDALLFQIEATNGPATFTTGPLPTGLSLEPMTGLIFGIPEAFGQFTIPLGASNMTGTATDFWTVNIAASGPPTRIQWDLLPDTITQGLPFQARISARDAADRLVRNPEGLLELTATARSGEASPVLIHEIRDSGTDGLTLVNLDPTISTRGWRLVLNAAADGTLTSVHGVDAPGRIYDLPDSFTRLDLPENQLGFNLVWSDDSPAQRQGGRQGWALIIDEFQQAVDFVAWGYPSEALDGLTVHDEQGRRVTGTGWQGPGVAHPGNIGYTLTRPMAIDSDSASDWEWVPSDAVPTLVGPSFREVPFAITVLEQVLNPDGSWLITAQTSGFGSEIQFTAKALLSGFRATSPVISILPSGPPVLPASLIRNAVVNQPLALPSLNHPLTETLSISNPLADAQLILDVQRILVRFDSVGSFQLPITARNAVGESTTVMNVTVIPDSDGDGLSDAWEAAFSQTDAGADADGDGLSNLTESITKTDPNDDSSWLGLSSITLSDRQVVLNWSSRPHGVYTVEAGRYRHGQLIWQPIHDGWIVPESAEGTYAFYPSTTVNPHAQLLRVRAWQDGVE